MKNILIIDDSQALCEVLLQALDDKRYEVISRYSGQEGHGVLEDRDDIDLMICDLNLPGLGGLELVEKARQMDRHKLLPVIIISGDKSEELVKEARRLGVKAWMTKPLDPIKIASMIDDFMAEVT